SQHNSGFPQLFGADDPLQLRPTIGHRPSFPQFFAKLLPSDWVYLLSSKTCPPAADPSTPQAARPVRACSTRPHPDAAPGLPSLAPVPRRCYPFFLCSPGGTMSFSLEGRVAVVFGVANKRSIAWSIAKGLHQAGAKLAITYQNERLEQEAKDLILSLPGADAFMCDVCRDEDIARVFSQLKERYGKLHVLVHSVAFAPAEGLKDDFVNTTREW